MHLTRLTDTAEEWTSCMKYECERDPWCYGCFAGKSFCDDIDLRICEQSLDEKLKMCGNVSPDCWRAIREKKCSADSSDTDVCDLNITGCNRALDRLCS